MRIDYEYQEQTPPAGQYCTAAKVLIGAGLAVGLGCRAVRSAVRWWVLGYTYVPGTREKVYRRR